MINRLLSCFCLILSLSLFQVKAQDINLKLDKNLQNQISLLDELMQNNDPKILDLLRPDVSFGHSNGWIQNFNDFKKDIDDQKINYQSVNQTELKELKTFKNTASVRRIVHVKGLYKTFNFEMNLSLLEIWIKKNKTWKLWSRQSIELKP